MTDPAPETPTERIEWMARRSEERARNPVYTDEVRAEFQETADLLRQIPSLKDDLHDAAVLLHVASDFWFDSSKTQGQKTAEGGHAVLDRRWHDRVITFMTKFHENPYQFARNDAGPATARVPLPSTDGRQEPTSPRTDSEGISEHGSSPNPRGSQPEAPADNLGWTSDPFGESSYSRALDDAKLPYTVIRSFSDAGGPRVIALVPRRSNVPLIMNAPALRKALERLCYRADLLTREEWLSRVAEVTPLLESLSARTASGEPGSNRRSEAAVPTPTAPVPLVPDGMRADTPSPLSQSARETADGGRPQGPDGEVVSNRASVPTSTNQSASTRADPPTYETCPVCGENRLETHVWRDGDITRRCSFCAAELETETVAALRAEVETLRTHNSKLYNNVKKFEEERDSARAQLAHQQSVNRELSQHLTSARAEVERLTANLESARIEYRGWESQAAQYRNERDSAQTLLLEALDHQGNLGDCKEHHCSWLREACKIRDSKSAREPIKGRDGEPPSAAARADPSPVVISTFDAIARDLNQKENPS
jgi:uncharacterized coiled-coil protein SlyX